MTETKRIDRLMQLDEQGLLLELPCKIGDTVWRVCGTAYKWKVQPRTVEALGIFPDRITIQHETECDVLGVRVFAAREEAEAEMAKREAQDALHGGSEAKGLLEELKLCTRTYNLIRRHGVKTIAELANMTEEELLKVRGMGKRSLDEIIEKMEAYDNENTKDEAGKLSGCQGV